MMATDFFALPLLCFDTAGDQLLVSLVLADNKIITDRRPMVHGQAEEILPAIKKILAAGAVDITALQHIFVTLGPGSFTGLRVGAAAAMGLGFGLSMQWAEQGFDIAGDEKKSEPPKNSGKEKPSTKKIHGIGNLPAMLLTHLGQNVGQNGGKQQYDEDKIFLVMAESRRVDVFYQRFQLQAGDKKITPLMATPMTASKEQLLTDYPDDIMVMGAVDFEIFLKAVDHYHGYDFITDRIIPLYARPADTIKKSQ